MLRVGGSRSWSSLAGLVAVGALGLLASVALSSCGRRYGCGDEPHLRNADDAGTVDRDSNADRTDGDREHADRDSDQIDPDGDGLDGDCHDSVATRDADESSVNRDGHADARDHGDRGAAGHDHHHSDSDLPPPWPRRPLRAPA